MADTLSAVIDAARTVDKLDERKLAKAKAALRAHLMRISRDFTGLDWNEHDDQLLDLVTSWVQSQHQRGGARLG